MGKNVDPVFERTFIMVGIDRQIKQKTMQVFSCSL